MEGFESGGVPYFASGENKYWLELLPTKFEESKVGNDSVIEHDSNENIKDILLYGCTSYHITRFNIYNTHFLTIVFDFCTVNF